MHAYVLLVPISFCPQSSLFDSQATAHWFYASSITDKKPNTILIFFPLVVNLVFILQDFLFILTALKFNAKLFIFMNGVRSVSRFTFFFILKEKNVVE